MSKRLKTRFGALCMTLVLMFSMAVSASAADSDFNIVNNDWLVKYNGPGGDVVIPDSVTSINLNAFSGCTGLTSITIPASVKGIGDYAFSGCTGLKSITIPNGVTRINRGTFRGCTSLTSVTIPDSVTFIAHDAFGGCTSLMSITLPDSLESIGDDAFRSCTSLKSITIPASVTRIGYNIFAVSASDRFHSLPVTIHIAYRKKRLERKYQPLNYYLFIRKDYHYFVAWTKIDWPCPLDNILLVEYNKKNSWNPFHPCQ